MSRKVCNFAVMKQNMQMSENEERLCKTIEDKVGRKMEAPQDFVWLAGQIWQTIHENVSVNTLKRLWRIDGYEEVVPRRYTLNILSQFAGYKDYATFCIDKGKVNSQSVLTRHLYAKDLEKGDEIQLTWLPDRLCVVTHVEKNRFIISKVENSKLSVGDTFECSVIIEGEPLYLNNLFHNGIGPSLYVVGKMSGVHFEIRED